jgi:hypothetical protein
MRTCVKCERPAAARLLCSSHYKQEFRAGRLEPTGRVKPKKAEGLQLLVQQGLNRSCVDCGDRPFGGGMRCLDCFNVRCQSKADSVPHQFPDPATYGTYVKGCRCRDCRAASAGVKRASRNRVKAAA